MNPFLRSSRDDPFKGACVRGLALFIVLGLCGDAMAAVPSQIPLQGVLRDNAGHKRQSQTGPVIRCQTGDPWRI